MTAGNRLRSGALLLAVAGYCSGLALPGMIAMLLAQVWSLRTMAWRWISTPIDVPLAALALAVTASAIASPWRDEAAPDAVFFVLALVVSIPAVAAYVRLGADRIRVLLLVWIGGGVVSALLVVAQAWMSRFTVLPTGADLESTRIGTLLTSAFILTLGLGTAGSLKGRWAMPVSAILVAGLFATLSRAAWLGAIAGILVLIIIGAGGRVRLALALACGILGLLAVVHLARPFADVAWPRGERTLSMHPLLLEFRSIFSLQKNRNRLVLWRTAAKMATDHPVIGTGFGTFRLAFEQYEPPDSEIPNPPFAHNVFLNFAVETGVPGLAAFVALYAAGLASTWRWFARSPPGSAGRATAMTVFATLVAFLVAEFFDGAAMTVHAGFGILALLTIGAAGARYLTPDATTPQLATNPARPLQGTDGVPIRSRP